METFHEMIAADCYCCGVWPSILPLNVRGRALREQRSLHCTAAQITTWTGSSSARPSANSGGGPPLKCLRQRSHCGAEYEAVCPTVDGPLPSQWSSRCFLFVFFIISESQRMTRRWGSPHTERCRRARVAFLRFCLRKNVLELVHN